MDPFDVLILMVSDLWGYYAIAFVGLGWFLPSIIPSELGAVSANSPFHTVWILLGVFMAIAMVGAIWRWLETPDPAKDGKQYKGAKKSKRPQYAPWFSGALAVAGVGFFLYALFPMRDQINADSAGSMTGYWLSLLLFAAGSMATPPKPHRAPFVFEMGPQRGVEMLLCHVKAGRGSTWNTSRAM